MRLVGETALVLLAVAFCSAEARTQKKHHKDRLLARSVPNMRVGTASGQATTVYKYKKISNIRFAEKSKKQPFPLPKEVFVGVTSEEEGPIRLVAFMKAPPPGFVKKLMNKLKKQITEDGGKAPAVIGPTMYSVKIPRSGTAPMSVTQSDGVRSCTKSCLGPGSRDAEAVVKFGQEVAKALLDEEGRREFKESAGVEFDLEDVEDPAVIEALEEPARCESSGKPGKFSRVVKMAMRLKSPGYEHGLFAKSPDFEAQPCEMPAGGCGNKNEQGACFERGCRWWCARNKFMKKCRWKNDRSCGGPRGYYSGGVPPVPPRPSKQSIAEAKELSAKILEQMAQMEKKSAAAKNVPEKAFKQAMEKNAAAENDTVQADETTSLALIELPDLNLTFFSEVTTMEEFLRFVIIDIPIFIIIALAYIVKFLFGLALAIVGGIILGFVDLVMYATSLWSSGGTSGGTTSMSLVWVVFSIVCVAVRPMWDPQDCWLFDHDDF